MGNTDFRRHPNLPVRAGSLNPRVVVRVRVACLLNKRELIIRRKNPPVKPTQSTPEEIADEVSRVRVERCNESLVFHGAFKLLCI